MPKKSKGTSGSTPTTVYQLKIMLRGTKPPIWRRVQVGDCSLAELHNIIQVCMGWQFSHLYDFEVAGERYGDPQLNDDVESDRKVKLSQIVRAGHGKFTYVYDMGDNWEHTIQIEKTVATEPKVKYPRCIDGARACPPEDCGGIWDMWISSEPSRIPSTRSTKRCWNGWVASSTRRHLTSTG